MFWNSLSPHEMLYHDIETPSMTKLVATRKIHVSTFLRLKTGSYVATQGKPCCNIGARRLFCDQKILVATQKCPAQTKHAVEKKTHHRTTGLENSVATEKASVVTQTSKRAVAFSRPFCTSCSHPIAIIFILLPLYTFCMHYKIWKTANTTLNKSKSKFLLEDFSFTYTKIGFFAQDFTKIG